MIALMPEVDETLPVRLNEHAIIITEADDAKKLANAKKAARKRELRQQEKNDNPLLAEERKKKQRLAYNRKKIDNPGDFKQIVALKHQKARERMGKLKVDDPILFEAKKMEKSEIAKRKRVEEKEDNPIAYSEKIREKNEKVSKDNIKRANTLSYNKNAQNMKNRYLTDAAFRGKAKEKSRNQYSLKAKLLKRMLKKRLRVEEAKRQKEKNNSISISLMKEFLSSKFKWNEYTLASMKDEEVEIHYKLHNLYFQENLAAGHAEDTAALNVIEKLCNNIVVHEGDGHGSKILNWANFYKFRERVATKEKLVKAVYCDMGTLNHSNCEQYHDITEGLYYARLTISLAAANIVRGTKKDISMMHLSCATRD